MSTIEIKLIPFAMPNFIRLDVDGKEKPTIAVGKLSREQAVAYSETLKEAFLTHWQHKSKP